MRAKRVRRLLADASKEKIQEIEKGREFEQNRSAIKQTYSTSRPTPYEIKVPYHELAQH